MKHIVFLALVQLFFVQVSFGASLSTIAVDIPGATGTYIIGDGNPTRMEFSIDFGRTFEEVAEIRLELAGFTELGEFPSPEDASLFFPVMRFALRPEPLPPSLEALLRSPEVGFRLEESGAFVRRSSLQGFGGNTTDFNALLDGRVEGFLTFSLPILPDGFCNPETDICPFIVPATIEITSASLVVSYVPEPSGVLSMLLVGIGGVVWRN